MSTNTQIKQKTEENPLSEEEKKAQRIAAIKELRKGQVAALQVVLDETLARGKKGRIPPKVNMEGYEPQNGITCVMNPTKETIQKFGEPFYEAIVKDPVITGRFFPVPPAGHHVTLIGQ